MKDYSKMSKMALKKEEVIDRDKRVEDITVESEAIEQVEGEVAAESKSTEQSPEKILKGEVVNCNKLNVRKAPSKSSDILCAIDKGTVVTIDQTPSDPSYDDNIYDSWAHVRINGIVGYVMGEYLKEVSEWKVYLPLLRSCLGLKQKILTSIQISLCKSIWR